MRMEDCCTGCVTSHDSSNTAAARTPLRSIAVTYPIASNWCCKTCSCAFQHKNLCMQDPLPLKHPEAQFQTSYSSSCFHRIPPVRVFHPRSDGRGFPPGFRIDRIHAPLVRETFLHNGLWAQIYFFNLSVPSLLEARMLLGAPGLTTSNKKLLGAPGIATRSKDATRGSWPSDY